MVRLALSDHERQQLLELATRHGMSNLRVFGSVSRGEARPDSDVDLLVDAERGRSLLDPEGLENDESSARPVGSMEVLRLIWWPHNSKSGQYSSADVHRSLEVHADGSYSLTALDGLTPEEIKGR